MSKSKAPATAPVQPYPDRGGSFVLDEGAMTLKPAETADETPVQTPIDTLSEQEPQ